MGAGQSAAGSAWTTLPPMVPRFRTWAVADLVSGLGQSGAHSPQSGVAVDRVVGRERTDLDLAVGDFNAADPRDATDVDEDGGRGESQFHQRDQTVSACQDLCVFVFVEQADGFLSVFGAW